MVGHLSKLPGCTVVQIVGSVPTLELDVNSMELVRRVADCAGGPVYPLYVPLLVDSPEMAAALRSDPHVHKTIAMFDRLTKAVVGIGAWTASGSTVRAALPEELAAALDAAGAVADICSTVLDADGARGESRGIAQPFHCHQPGAAEGRPGCRGDCRRRRQGARDPGSPPQRAHPSIDHR